jgi:hypothetical protein
MNIEQVILRNLLVDEKYMRKVLPFVQPEYFEGVYKNLFKQVGKFVKWSWEIRGKVKYNELVELQNEYKIKCYALE